MDLQYISQQNITRGEVKYRVEEKERSYLLFHNVKETSDERKRHLTKQYYTCLSRLLYSTYVYY